MSNEIKQKLVDYLASHRYMRFATVTDEGKPQVRTVAYASDGATVYFATDRRTRKVQAILRNPNVAYSVDEDYDDVSKIQGIQMEAKASLLSDKADIDKAASLLMKVFPNMPELPSDLEVVFVRVEPAEAFFLDYTKGFTHTDKVTF